MSLTDVSLAHWHYPVNMLTMLLAVRGLVPKITGAYFGSVTLPTGSVQQMLDRSSVGPSILLVFNIDPSETELNSTLKVVCDGSTLHEVTGLDPSGNNFFVGCAWAGQTAGSGDSTEPTIAGVFCASGFELWGERTVPGSVDAQYRYITYNV